MSENELISQRAEKVKVMMDKGESPYSINSFDKGYIGDYLSQFEENKRVTIAGRIIQRRLHGKAAFADIRDSSGKIQCYLKKDVLGDEQFEDFKNLDVGDIVGVTGELFTTHTGQPTVKVNEVKLLSKAVRPLPEKWHGLKDVEIRYRQRYLDLAANPLVYDIFMMRSRVILEIRDFLNQRSFVEVETPMIHSIPGGAAGRPFKTYHNEHEMNLYMRIAPELYLKRLLVGGFERIYEINRSFRNEGLSTRHNPEFTMLEVYEAFTDYMGMMKLCEELVSGVIKNIFNTTKLEYQGKEVDFTPPWHRVSFAGLVKDKFGILPEDDAGVMLEKLRLKGAVREGIKLTRSQVTKLVEDLLEAEIPHSPVFVTDYFTSMSPLAKASKNNPHICERFEFFVAGMEVGNAYSELNDPFEQRKRFEDELKELAAEDSKTLDDDFIVALEHGMPPAGGLGIGIDRLIMLITNQPSIRDVILFPLLRPEVEE